MAGELHSGAPRTPQRELILIMHNEISACPTHDVTFDQGLISVADDLTIVRSPALTNAVARDARMAHNFGSQGLRDQLLVPSRASGPNTDYLTWHREHLFRAA